MSEEGTQKWKSRIFLRDVYSFLLYPTIHASCTKQVFFVLSIIYPTKFPNSLKPIWFPNWSLSSQNELVPLSLQNVNWKVWKGNWMVVICIQLPYSILSATFELTEWQTFISCLSLNLWMIQNTVLCIKTKKFCWII